MQTTVETPPLRSQGLDIDVSENAFGFLRNSAALVGVAAALRERMTEDGYLYLPGLLNRAEVEAARISVLERAAADGLLDPEFPVAKGILKPNINPYFKPEYAQENAALHKILYDGPMIQFFENFFGESVRHFDYTWLRAVGAGLGTSPHCDTVYMGRGTPDLLTAWTPLGDVPLTVGGLMLLENSHRRVDVLRDYLRQDVDTYCENGPNAEAGANRRIQLGALGRFPSVSGTVR